MPSATVSMAAAAKPGARRINRSPYFMSCAAATIHITPRASRDSSTSGVVGPNSRRAAARAACGAIPRATFSSTMCSRCSRISSARSASTASDRINARVRMRSICSNRIDPRTRTPNSDPATRTLNPEPDRHSRRSDDQRDRRGEPLPRCGFLLELFPSGFRQRVELRASLVFGDAPLRGDPTLVLETLERGIERSLLDQQHVVGELSNPPRDGPPVQRLEHERLEDEQIERALDEVDRFHGYDYLQH